MPRRSIIAPHRLSDSEQSQLEGYYRVHSEALYQYALFLTRDRERARDLLQDTFVHIAERFTLYDSRRAFLPFAKRVMRNLYIDQCRKRAVKTVPLLAERD